jgi:formate dehydrogenase subunit delta
MDDRDLVRMANQIGDYFKSYPEDQALKEISGHITSFWDPRMRKHLAAHLAKGGAGLQPIVLKAVKDLAVPA